MIKRVMLAIAALAALVVPGVAMAGSASAAPHIAASACTPGFRISGGTGAVTYTITRGCSGRSFRAHIANSATLQTSNSSWAHESVGAQRTALLAGGNICALQDEPTGHVGGPTRSFPTKC